MLVVATLFPFFFTFETQKFSIRKMTGRRKSDLKLTILCGFCFVCSVLTVKALNWYNDRKVNIEWAVVQVTYVPMKNGIRCGSILRSRIGRVWFAIFRAYRDRASEQAIQWNAIFFIVKSWPMKLVSDSEYTDFCPYVSAESAHIHSLIC